MWRSVVTGAFVLGAFPSAPALGADDPVVFRGSLSWLNAAIHTTPADSAVNPDNATLRIPANRAISELRPNLKLTTSSLQLLFRPRIRFEATEVEVKGDKGTTQGSTDTSVSEAYGQWTVSDSLTFAYGLQSYQWGAAEALSPSNRIFHETAQSKTTLYDVRGRNLARLNFSLGKRFTTVVMAEVEENEDLDPFSSEETYQSVGLVKPELNWNDGADYFGFVAGGREHGRPWVGEYFSVTLPWPDGLAFYADASHQKGSDAWYPVMSAGTSPASDHVVFDRSKVEDRKIYTLAVVGLKYDFVGGTILRAEYIRNDAAYDDKERELALLAFRSPSPLALANLETNLARFLAPGLEVPGQELAYASAHLPEPFDVKDLTFYVRATRSLTDHSLATYGSTEYKVGDAGTVSYAASGSQGDDDTELKGYNTPTHILAYRHDW